METIEKDDDISLNPKNIIGKQSQIKKVLEINSYGNNSLDLFKKKEIYNYVPSAFCDFFASKGYSQEDAVSIGSGIDDSVYFIGAPTSVLKKYLLNGTIPEKGICMQQSSFRTHNAKRLKDDSNIKRGSTFTGISCMSNYDDGKELLENTVDFLLNVLKIPLRNIAINISSKDQDLLALLESIQNPIPLVFDTKDPKYYTHRYGLGDITGRNFNFVLKDEHTGSFNDIGNYIIIESPEKKYGIESGFGNSVIIKEMYSLEHVLDASLISNLVEGNSVVHRKLQDSIVVSFLMCELGIIPRRHDTKGRIFKTYLSGMKYNQELLNMKFDELENILKVYEKMEYGDSVYTDLIVSYLKKMGQ